MNSTRFGQSQENLAEDTGAEAAFPSARYFQIHFQHLYELIDELKAQMRESSRQLAELQQNRQQEAATEPTEKRGAKPGPNRLRVAKNDASQ